MSEFAVQIPDRAAADTPVAAAGSPAVDAAAPPIRIMVVDDMPENLALIKNILKDRGFEVFPLPNGALALRAAQRQRPDLVLLDITMPDMDGYEVCRRFKTDPALRDVPIIFLSALSDTDDKVKGFNAGGVDFITKPFQYEEVLARVMTHLKLRELQARLEYQNTHLQQLVDAKVRQLADAHMHSRRQLDEIAHMNRNITAAVYAAALAHELNQPLAAILSNAEAAELYLSMEPPDLGEAKNILADIRRDNRRASELIQRLQGMLKKSESTVTQLDLRQVVEEVLQLLASEAKMRHVTLRAELPPFPLPVLADRIQLQQVLINLLLNSMDAMADTPDEHCVVTVGAGRAAAWVEVTVTDGGAGFDANIERVFDSFFTTKTHGMGLGLSISAAIIHAHGGQIRAENAPAGGAIVRFALPLNEEAAG